MCPLREQSDDSQYEKGDNITQDHGLASESHAFSHQKGDNRGCKKVSNTDCDEEKAEEVSDSVAITVDRKKMALLSLAMAFAVFLFALDETIIATAIPKITDQFNSLTDVGWYGSAYLLTMCCFQLHYGKLYKLFSTKIVFLVSIAIFEVGSLLCAVCPNSSALIVGRALSGSRRLWNNERRVDYHLEDGSSSRTSNLFCGYRIHSRSCGCRWTTVGRRNHRQLSDMEMVSVQTRDPRR